MARRTAEAAAQTRAAIVASARSLFVRRGFNAASTTEIAEHAGCSQSALFHHFPDKRSLFQAVLIQEIAAFDDEVRQAALAERDPVAMFLAGCRRSLELAADPGWSRLVAVDAPSVLDEEQLRQLDASLGRATTLFGLGMLRESGHLDRAADAEALTTVIYGSLTEAAFDLVRRTDAADPERVVAVIARLIDAFAPATSVHARMPQAPRSADDGPAPAGPRA